MKLFLTTLTLCFLLTLTQETAAISLTCIRPTEEKTNTTTDTLGLQVEIKGNLSYFYISIYLNDVLIDTQNVNVVDKFGGPNHQPYNSIFTAQLFLRSGENRIRLQVTDGSGTATLHRKIYYSRPAKPFATERRKALVIGNAAYVNLLPLSNCLNDADSMAKALHELNFEIVLIKNGTKEQMKRLLDNFCEDLLLYDVALLYYSGHGFETWNLNCMLPVDASQTDAKDLLECFSISSNYGYASLSDRFVYSGVPKSIFILDACRSNEMGNSMQIAYTTKAANGWGKNAVKGNMIYASTNKYKDIAPGQSFIAYATYSGHTADASAPGLSNSPYTYATLKYIRNVNLSLAEIFTKVKATMEDVLHLDVPPFYDHFSAGYILSPYDERLDDRSVDWINNHDKASEHYDGIVRNVWLDTNAVAIDKGDTLKGIRFHIDFEIARMLNSDGRLWIELYENDLTFAKDNDPYHKPYWKDEKILVETYFSSRFKLYTNPDLSKDLFVSYSTLAPSLKGQKMYYRVSAAVNDTLRLKCLPQPFTLPNW